MLRQSPLFALACAMILVSCADAPTAYRACPEGVDPASYDCLPRTIGGGGADVGGPDSGPADAGGDGSDDVGPRPDIGTDAGGPDTGCVPMCTGRECGNDGCGGVCGTCGPGFGCSAGACAPRGGGGDLSCRGLLDCLQSCNGGEACSQRCYESGTPEAQDQFRGIVECIEINCADATDDEQMARCQQEACGGLIEECWRGGNAGGDLACDEVFYCMVDCGGEEGCQEDCYFSGTPIAQRALGGLLDCVADQCEGVASIDEYIDCAYDRCPRFAGACFEGGAQPPPPAEGLCTEDDLALLERVGDEAPVAFVECGASCRTPDGDVDKECARECVAGWFGIFGPCSECLGELSVCAVTACAPPCEADPSSDRCGGCVEGRCGDEFAACSGF